MRSTTLGVKERFEIGLCQMIRVQSTFLKPRKYDGLLLTGWKIGMLESTCKYLRVILREHFEFPKQHSQGVVGIVITVLIANFMLLVSVEGLRRSVKV